MRQQFGLEHEEPMVTQVRNGWLARGSNLRFAVIAATEAAARDLFALESAAWRRLVDPPVMPT